MSHILIKAMGGLRPLQSALLLDAAEATVASNVKLLGGSVVPLKSTSTLKALTKTTPATIWRYGTSATETNYWFEFLADTDVIASPIAADPYARAYWSDGTQAKYGPSSLLLTGTDFPGGSYNLGIAAPAAVPTFTFTAPGTGVTPETRVYCYTYVSAYGEEGPPTGSSASHSIDPSLSCTVTMSSVGPGGAVNIATKRLYRSSTVGSAAQWQFVAEVPVATTSYVDSLTQGQLGEVLVSETWIAPPAALKGLKLLANGAAIGFKGNTVYLSEPNQPHAWPNQYPFSEQIVGIGVFRQGAVIVTTGYPYLLTGTDPGAMTPERLELPQGGVSKRSIVDTSDGCLYVSNEGVVSVGSGGMVLATEKLLTKEQWAAYNPSSMQCALHDGRYHIFYTTSGGTRGMLILDPTARGAPLTACDVNQTTAVTAVYTDPRTSKMYMSQGTNIVRFDDNGTLSMTWRSKPFRLESEQNFAAGAVDASAYPVTLKGYGDGALMFTKTVTDDNPFRLPDVARKRDWQLEVSGTNEVTRIRVAASMRELKQAQ